MKAETKEECCAPACGPETCPPGKSRKKLFGALGAVVVVLVGGWLAWTQVLNGKTAIAEVVLEDGAVVTSSVIDQAIREASFKGAEVISRNGGVATCRLKGLGGQCCRPGAVSALKKLKGVKEVVSLKLE